MVIQFLCSFALLRDLGTPFHSTPSPRRHHVEFLHQLMEKAGISSCCVYGNLDAAARKINVAKFRARKSNVLVVTDIAARGIGRLVTPSSLLVLCLPRASICPSTFVDRGAVGCVGTLCVCCPTNALWNNKKCLPAPPVCFCSSMQTFRCWTTSSTTTSRPKPSYLSTALDARRALVARALPTLWLLQMRCEEKEREHS